MPRRSQDDSGRDFGLCHLTLWVVDMVESFPHVVTHSKNGYNVSIHGFTGRRWIGLITYQFKSNLWIFYFFTQGSCSGNKEIPWSWSSIRREGCVFPYRFLIVEDSSDDAELIVRHLNKEGFQVEWKRVETREDFVSALSVPYDLILADWFLPQFSGMLALKIKHERGLDTPFIIISGSIGEEAAVEAMRLGAFDAILKDRPGRLAQSVHNALEQQHMVAEKKEAGLILRTSEQRLRALLTQAQVILFSLNDTGIIQFAAGSLLAKLGTAPDQVIGQTIFDFFNGPPQFRESFQAALAGEATSLVAHKAGMTMEIHLSPVPDENQHWSQVIGVAVDITERTHADLERETAVNTLRESEERYRIMFDTMPIGILVLDRFGHSLSVNPAALEILGISADDFQKMTLPDPKWKCIYEDGSEIPGNEHPALVALRTGKPVNHNVIGIYNQVEGRYRWVQMTSLPQFRAGEVAPYQVYSVFNDISELRLAQENLRQTHQQLDAIIQAAPLGISAVDRDGQVILWSPSAERLFGWTQEEVLGKKLPTIPENTFQEVMDQIRDEVKGLNRMSMDLVRKRKDGTLVDISVSTAPLRDQQGNFEGSMAIYENIASRKQAESQLHLLSTALEAAGNAIVITDQTGAIEWINPAWTELTGYSAAEALGKNPRLLKSGKHENAFYQKLWDTIQAGEVWHSEIINKRKDGSVYFEDETITPLVDANGKISHFIGIKQDITERKQREHELETVAMMSAALRSASDRAEMLPIILDQLISLLDIEAATIEMLDPVNGELLIELGRGAWASATGQRIPRGQGLSAEVLATRQPYLNNDVKSGNRMFRPDLFAVISAAAGVLLMVQDKLLGLLWIGSRRPLSSQDLRLLTASADIAANAIHRAVLHEQTEYRLRQLSALRTIDQAITSSFDLSMILKIFVEQITVQLEVDAAAVLLFNPNTFTLEFSRGYGFLYPDIKNNLILLGEGKIGNAALGPKPMDRINLADTEPDPTRAAMFKAEGFVFHYAVPVVVKSQLKGMLEVFHRKPLQPSYEWFQFLEAFANQVAIAIDNIQMFEGLQRSNLDLGLAYDATIEGWSRALDLRDRETENHTLRVTDLTIKIAADHGHQ